MAGIVDFLVSNLGKVAATAGGALAAFLVSKVLGPKVLSKFFNTRSRAQLLEDGAQAVADFLRPAIKATPNKFDDIGLAILDALKDWADKQGVTLTDAEVARAHLAARVKLASEIAFAAATSAVK